MEIVYNPQKEKWNEICSRLTTSYSENELVVKKIFQDIKNKGDEALIQYTLKYDNVLIKDFLVSETEISNSTHKVDFKLKNLSLSSTPLYISFDNEYFKITNSTKSIILVSMGSIGYNNYGINCFLSSRLCSSSDDFRYWKWRS